MPRLEVQSGMSAEELVRVVREWIGTNVPEQWQRAAREGGAPAIRAVRTRADYEAWYPAFGESGLVVPNWPPEYGGLGLTAAEAQRVESELAPFNLGRLNPLGLNLAAPALFAHGSETQRRRFLPPIVRNEEVWCQLFSEPGAGSDLASLATRAERDGEHWFITGQKVWSTWAHLADFGVLLARTEPDKPKRKGLTYFLIALRQAGVTVRPLRHITGEHDFNEVFFDRAVVPDDQRVGAVNDGWRVAGATLSGERQMVAGAGSGGVDRIGGSGARRLLARARDRAARQPRSGFDDPLVRQALMQLVSAEEIRAWTNLRVRAGLQAGRAPGAESSIGKVHQGELNQETQLLATDLLGLEATAWPHATGGPQATAGRQTTAGPQAKGGPDWNAGEDNSEHTRDYSESLPYVVQGMLRSRANTIEGGTSEVNKTIVAERVLGLPREPDPWRDKPWREVPRS